MVVFKRYYEALTLAIEALEQREKPKEGINIESAKDILQRHCDQPIDGKGVYDTGFTNRDISRQVINAMHEYHNQFPSVKVSDEEIDKISKETYGDWKDDLLHFKRGLLYMRSRMSNNKTE